MTTLAQRPCAEPAPALVTGTHQLFAEQLDDAIATEAFPAWSSLSWEERADYVGRHCL